MHVSKRNSGGRDGIGIRGTLLVNKRCKFCTGELQEFDIVTGTGSDI